MSGKRPATAYGRSQAAKKTRARRATASAAAAAAPPPPAPDAADMALAAAIGQDEYDEAWKQRARARGYAHDRNSGMRPRNMPRVTFHPRRGLMRGRRPRRTDLIMPKRRSYSGRGMYGEPSAAVVRRRFPDADFGRKYVKRGVAGSQNMRDYGPSWAEATDEQRELREAHGYRGRGRYRGRGGFLSGATSHVANTASSSTRTAIRNAGTVADFRRSQNQWLHGRGGYIGRSLGRWAGSKVGAGDIGAKVGDWVGDKAWGGFKNWLGLGLYEGSGAYGPAANSLISGSGRKPPMFGSVPDETGALIVQHREYIGDIFGNAADELSFKNRPYELNPGLERTFPWLSQIAQNYEEYEFGQLVFEYKATVADSVASDGQVGTCVMVTNYNAASRSFDDKNSMMQYDGCSSSRTTQSQIHGVECDPRKISGSSGHYIRATPKEGQDKKTYDHGLFQLATVGLPDSFKNEPVGELWVFYTVKLRKPRLFSAKGLNLSRDIFLNNGKTGQPLASSGLVLAKATTNNIGSSLVFNASFSDENAIKANGGYYDLFFPASFSGNLEVRLTAAGGMDTDMKTGAGGFVESNVSGYIFAKWKDSHTSTPGTLELKTATGSATLPGGAPDKNHPDKGSRGNITIIKDILGGYPHSTDDAEAGMVGEFTTGAHTSIGSASDAHHDRVIAICHVKVDVASHGIDNVLTMWIPDFDIASQTCVEVVEYNTFNLGLKKPLPAYELMSTGAPVDPTKRF